MLDFSELSNIQEAVGAEHRKERKKERRKSSIRLELGKEGGGDKVERWEVYNVRLGASPLIQMCRCQSVCGRVMSSRVTACSVT